MFICWQSNYIYIELKVKDLHLELRIPNSKICIYMELVVEIYIYIELEVENPHKLHLEPRIPSAASRGNLGLKFSFLGRRSLSEKLANRG